MEKRIIKGKAIVPKLETINSSKYKKELQQSVVQVIDSLNLFSPHYREKIGSQHTLYLKEVSKKNNIVLQSKVNFLI